METKKVPLDEAYKVIALKYILSESDYTTYELRAALKGNLNCKTHKDIKDSININKIEEKFNFTDTEQLVDDLYTYAYAVYFRNNNNDAFTWSELEKLAHNEPEKTVKNTQKDTNNGNQ